MTIARETLAQEALNLLQKLISIPSFSEEEDLETSTVSAFFRSEG